MSELNDRSLGIKALSTENRCKPDDAAQVFAYTTDGGEICRMGGDGWAAIFLTPRLSSNCPDEVIVAFETARGALVYGYYFYPLYALGQRELLQVADMALRVRSDQLSIPSRLGTFAERVSWLHEAGELTVEEANAWTLIRRMRNSLVHSSSATIVMPGNAAQTLTRIADLTRALYA